MLIRQVALVSDTNQLDVADVARVAAALQKQATRDFGPIWDVQATVDGFARLEDVPLGYWPILVGDEGQGGGGVHLDENNQPFALVDLTNEWTITASHECLEMLADPFGNRVVAGDSLDPRQGRVEYLVEVCDPCEAPEFGYTANGVPVSDFHTPRFFDPSQQGELAVQYDFQGHIKRPRQVLGGGYISWRDPATNRWFQQTFFGNQPEIRDIGVFEDGTGSLREWIDRRSREEQMRVMAKGPGERRGMVTAIPGQASRGQDRVSAATAKRAEALRARILKLRRPR
jgi:hypothetical protein